MSDSSAETLITLPQGQLQGVKANSIYDQPYYCFEGIPYGKPPVGELRFRAPQPAEPWTGVRDCSHTASKPLQNNLFLKQIEGSEDCLYLNVYAKKLKSDKPLPVMVFIYGGGFMNGEATRDLYAPDYFMSENVVLVNFNYRLDSLGFLCLKDPALNIPGNAGLKDQVLALKWIKQHISHFNGDPNNITVFGESAGGCSTHYMMATQQTKGLFQKAIPMSGCLTNMWANTPQTHRALQLARYHGYSGEDNDQQVYAFLQQLQPSQLVNHKILSELDYRNDYLFTFGPTVEPYITAETVIPEAPELMLKNCWSNQIPMLFGGVSFEGLLFYPTSTVFPKKIADAVHDPLRLVPLEVRQKFSEAENMQWAKQILQAHLGEKPLNDDAVLEFLDIHSFKHFWHGYYRTLLQRLSCATQPTYLYRFDYDSEDFNFYRQKFCAPAAVRGVAHADDLGFLFLNRFARKLNENSEEYRTIQRMVGIWTSFAKSSNPNCEAIGSLKWQPISKQEPLVGLNISNDVQLMELPEKQKLLFWENMMLAAEAKD